MSYLLQQTLIVLNSFSAEEFPDYNLKKIVRLFACCIKQGVFTYKTLRQFYEEIRAPKFNFIIQDIIYNFSDYLKTIEQVASA